ncbi:hypothetical protein LTR08_002338 [Meristemomyces frigidus]|nr:hypothetical protein LTR08_002338 [Meristemomyces frigidus]
MNVPPPVPATPTIDWAQGDHSHLVQLPDGGPRLFLRASGPARQSARTPAIVIEHGLGSGISEWVPVLRLVSRFARVYIYERAGYAPSDAPTKPPTPPNIAADLRALLAVAGVPPPYVLVGHSYGGTLMRQFVADYGPQDVVHGMVIVDEAPVMTPLPPTWTEMLGGATYQSVVGLDDNHVYSAGEYRTLMEECETNEVSIGEEEKGRQPMWQPVLKARLAGVEHPLGNWPLSVICCDMATDFSKLYEYGVQHGHGSPEAREALRKRLEDLSEVDEAAMREHLALSTNGRFVKAEGKQRTHNVHFVDPEFVVKEIEWVYRQSCVV